MAKPTADSPGRAKYAASAEKRGRECAVLGIEAVATLRCASSHQGDALMRLKG
jgi:hypothetical protein